MSTAIIRTEAAGCAAKFFMFVGIMAADGLRSLSRMDGDGGTRESARGGSEGARKRGSEGARERWSKGARERGSEGARERDSARTNCESPIIEVNPGGCGMQTAMYVYRMHAPCAPEEAAVQPVHLPHAA